MRAALFTVAALAGLLVGVRAATLWRRCPAGPTS